MIINNSITYLKGTARVPSEFWSLVTPGYVGWVRLCLFGELLDEKTCSRYFSTPRFALFPTLLRSQGSISELRNYIIKLHIVIIHQVESTCSPWRTLTCPGGVTFLLKRLRASAMKNMWGIGVGQSFCRARLNTWCGLLLLDLHYRKTIFYLFKLEIPLHLSFKCAANTLWSF